MKRYVVGEGVPVAGQPIILPGWIERKKGMAKKRVGIGQKVRLVLEVSGDNFRYAQKRSD